MANNIILITGGARSGKSSFAEQCAAAGPQPVAYIATAQIHDEEMEERVKLHQQRRPVHWLTWEAPYNAHEALIEAAKEGETILFDCLTLYTANLMLSPAAPADKKDRFHYVCDQIETLLTTAVATGKRVIFVTNEVGMGIVPANPMAREYRDLAGIVNQQVAAIAGEVYLSVCGITVDIKRLASNGGEKN